MEKNNQFFNTPDDNVSVNGEKWFPSREVKDIDGNVIYVKL